MIHPVFFFFFFFFFFFLIRIHPHHHLSSFINSSSSLFLSQLVNLPFVFWRKELEKDNAQSERQRDEETP